MREILVRIRKISTVSPIISLNLLRDMRLRRVRQVLETSDEPLESIAESCGLTDAAYLSRVFIQHFNQTPGQYREKAKNAAVSYMQLLNTQGTMYREL